MPPDVTPPVPPSYISPIKVRLGSRLRTLRKERGYSQIQLAMHADLGRAFVSDFETGKENASLETLEKLAKAFSMSISELMTGI